MVTKSIDMYLNKAIIIGNVTRDPELRSLPSGIQVCSFSVATNMVYIDKEGKQEKTEYHNVVIFGKIAETTSQYVRQGTKVMVEGRLQTRSWGEEVKKYKTEIVADNIQWIPKYEVEE